MNHRRSVDFGDSQQDALAEFRPGADPDMPQKRPGHFAEEGLHKVEPRSMLGCQHVLEAVGPGSPIAVSRLGNMRRVVVQNDANSAVSRVVLVEVLEQGDELPAAMAMLHTGCDMTLV